MPTSSPRAICPTCQRPEKVCLCQWIQPIHNLVEVGILQHPTEVSQIKGTAKIAELSLQKSHVWIGENFTDEQTLQAWLKVGEVFLLYPEIAALNEGGNKTTSQRSYDVDWVSAHYPLTQIKLLILDGTWRKTHKMMMQNTFLHSLKRLQLTPKTPSTYQIRKQKDAGSLSTIEAIYQALMQLEHDANKFQPLMRAFQDMVAQQLAFRTKNEPQPK